MSDRLYQDDVMFAVWYIFIASFISMTHCTNFILCGAIEGEIITQSSAYILINVLSWCGIVL